MKYKKICAYCNKKQSTKNFNKHILYKDRLDNRCKDCVKQHRKIRDDLHKTAPIKPKRCECCGKKPNRWCLDHDHKDNSFRGWLCNKCNEGLGKLGDDLDGVIKAVNYLLLAQNRKQQNESFSEMDSTS